MTNLYTEQSETLPLSAVLFCSSLIPRPSPPSRFWFQPHSEAFPIIQVLIPASFQGLPHHPGFDSSLIPRPSPPPRFWSLTVKNWTVGITWEWGYHPPLVSFRDLECDMGTILGMRPKLPQSHVVWVWDSKWLSMYFFSPQQWMAKRSKGILWHRLWCLSCWMQERFGGKLAMTSRSLIYRCVLSLEAFWLLRVSVVVLQVMGSEIPSFPSSPC